MTRIARMSACVAVAALVTLLLPGAAAAAPVREFQLQFAPAGETSQSLLIVTAVLDPEESLPASITVPVPAGATLLWSGELLGGNPEADPFREATRETVGTMDLYTFSLEQTRIAQVEVALGAPTFAGNRVSGTLTWTNPGAEVLVSSSVIAEPGAADVKTTPPVTGGVQENSIGETLHPLGGVRLAQGESLTLEASWRRGAAGGTGDSVVLPLLIGALVVVVIVLVIVVARERTRARRAAAPDAS